MSRGGNKVWNFVLLALVVYLAIGTSRGLASSLLVATIVMLAPFVRGPILIHRTTWSSMDRSEIPFDPSGPESPNELRLHFAEFSKELGRLGFTPERYYQTKGAMEIADACVLLYLNRKTWETAQITTVVFVKGVLRRAASSITFRSEFSDGTVLVTSNRANASLYPPRKPPYYGRAFPQVREVGRLLEVHRARVGNYAAGKIPIDAIGSDPDCYSRRIRFEAFDYHVACGYNYVDEMARVQRLTWKGAILGAWKLTPPIKQIRLGWERLMAAKQLSNLKSGRPVS